MSIKIKAKRKQVELFEKLPNWFTIEDKKLACLQIVSEAKKIAPYLYFDIRKTSEQMRASDEDFLDFWVEVENRIEETKDNANY
jgi:hypothetical protein